MGCTQRETRIHNPATNIHKYKNMKLTLRPPICLYAEAIVIGSYGKDLQAI
jgi:hypothetical protein